LVTPIESALTLGGLASRNDSNEITRFAFTVANEKEPGGITHTKEKEARFFGGVFIVVELDGKFVIEDRLGLLEGDTVLPEVGRSLGLIPFELDHTYSVLMVSSPSRGALTNEAKRHRLHRGAERSRDSEMMRENGRQCRRGPS